MTATNPGFEAFHAFDFEPKDDLETLLHWYVRDRPLFTVPAGGLMFTDNLCGACMFRHNNLQVEMFLVSPDTEIPDHIHPNVDSIEVALWGAQLRHSGHIAMSFDDMEACAGGALRVRPGDWHGGTASPQGACFLSFQKWLHEVPPTTVANDWSGEVMGSKHLSQITSGAAAAQQPTEEQPQ
jgi:hypothetical protein